MPRLTIAIGSRPKKPARENCHAPGTERTRRYGDSTGSSVHTGAVPGRVFHLVLGVVLLTPAAGCSSSEPDRPDEPAPRVAMSFSQHRIDEGSDRANLRVVNETDRPAQVTEIG